VGIRKVIALIALAFVIFGLAFEGILIERSVAEINDCGEACLDIKQAILGFEVNDLSIPRNLTIVLMFVFRNPSSLSAYLVNLPFIVEIAGIEIGHGIICCLPLLIPGNAEVEATGIIRLPFTQIPSLAVNAIREYQKGGLLQYVVRGIVTLRGAILGVLVPFIPSITKPFQKQGNFTVSLMPLS
jgi:hypothetical protein